jgi:hypothetical protein
MTVFCTKFFMGEKTVSDAFMNQPDENIACGIQFRALMRAVAPKRFSSNIPASFYLI